MRLIFVADQRPLCERNWSHVPRASEQFCHEGRIYIVQNISHEDNGLGEPTVYVYIISSEKYEKWLTGRKD